MGLSFHYSGRFNPEASLQEMIDEATDIVSVFHWKYKIFETSFPDNKFTEHYNDNLYGISFTPPESETISLVFLSNGRMSSGSYLKIFGNSDREDYQKFLYMLSVKTQFAGPEIHMLVINLIKHISKKYLLDFTLDDEGKYWETGDESILKETFSKYNELLNMVCNSLKNFTSKPDESIESFFERLIEHLNKKREAE